MSVDEQLLSMTEAAQVAGVSRSPLYTLLSHEEIRSLKIGRARRIRCGALEDFITARLGPIGASAEVRR